MSKVAQICPIKTFLSWTAMGRRLHPKGSKRTELYPCEQEVQGDPPRGSAFGDPHDGPVLR